MSDDFLRPQWIRGRTSRQAHADLPEGTVEEEHGREGFGGAASHLYRLHAPTAWESIAGPLQPVALDLRDLECPGDRELPAPLLENGDVRISWWARPVGTPDWFLREADGDVTYFVHRGTGVLETEYGPLPMEPGDLLVVPRGTTHRIIANDATAVLAIGALSGAVRVPDRGLLGRHALFDPAVVEVPEPEPHDEIGSFDVLVRRAGSTSTLTYPFHPFDVVGWKGDLAPYRLRGSDFRPVASARYHLPPSAHTVLRADGFVVAMFAPRPLESDPSVLRVPFFHRNADVDEVIFYQRGEFFSRAGIEAGMLTFHPAGIHHGPQPQAVARSQERGPGGFADEVALNIDVERPLALTPVGMSRRVPGYERSWQSAFTPDPGGDGRRP